MDAKQYRQAIADLKLTQEAAGVFFGYSKRTGQRWAAGHPIPVAVEYLIRLMEYTGATPAHLSGSYEGQKMHPVQILKEAQP